MQPLYLVSVWLHILAAITWIGGMFFLVLVVVPWLRRGNAHQAGKFLRETGIQFRKVGWVCFAILAITGTFNLWMRGVSLSSFTDPVWLASPYGMAIWLKLLGFLGVVCISLIHDFSVGPRATAAISEDPNSELAQKLRRRASFLGRLNALLALFLVAAAVVIVRGWPW